jgi:hypothetical protein
VETGSSVRVLGLFGYGKRMSVLGVLIVEVALIPFFLIMCHFIIGPIGHIARIAYSAIAADIGDNYFSKYKPLK